MRTKWVIPCGAIILKYRMAGKYYFLRYPKGESLECGNYNTFEKLKEAKNYKDGT